MPRYGTVLGLVLLLGCSQSEKTAATLTLATTTSTQDSGLLDILVPAFEAQTGITVKVIAVGSGQALALGRRGDADVLLTHAPALEEIFMTEGFGAERHPVMHNDFVLVGPKTAPAGILGRNSITQAFRQLAEAGFPFVSRSDDSGTHQAEQTLWKKVGVEPAGAWYLKAGAGMAPVLRMASEKQACTLSDRATFLALRQELDLHILVQGDALLRNRYAVIVVNPRRHPHVRHEAAGRLVQFLCSAEGRRRISTFGIDTHGEPLFFPEGGVLDAGPVDTSLKR